MQQIISRKISLQLFLSIIIASGFFSVPHVFAQGSVDYKGDVVVDSDLDGLTDKGETQLFGTDKKVPDSDSDGFYDGAEVLFGSDPLNASDPLASELVAAVGTETNPLAWYIGRAGGLVAYLFLWLTIFFGLSFRNPLLRPIIAPLYKLDFHKFLSLLTTGFIMLHMFVFLFDDYLQFSPSDILVPFVSDVSRVNNDALTLGILAFYGIVVLVLTSLFRAHIARPVWRTTHFLHIVVFVMVVAHAWMLGTDMGTPWVRNVFWVSVGIIAFLYVVSAGEAIVRLVKNYRQKKYASQQALKNSTAHLP